MSDKFQIFLFPVDMYIYPGVAPKPVVWSARVLD